MGMGYGGLFVTLFLYYAVAIPFASGNRSGEGSITERGRCGGEGMDGLMVYKKMNAVFGRKGWVKVCRYKKLGGAASVVDNR